MKTLLLVTLLHLLLASSSSGSGTHWSYDDPNQWGGTCDTQDREHRQSPIDIESFVPYETTPFIFKHYGFINTTLCNNGHTLKVSLHPGTEGLLPAEDENGAKEKAREKESEQRDENLKLGSKEEELRPQVSGGGLPGTYILDSFHFHWGSDSRRGSEHLLQGCAFVGELHLVHYKKEYGSVEEALKHPDGLAVLGIWLIPSHAKVHHYVDPIVSASKADYYFSPGTVPLQGICGYTKEEHQMSSQHWYDMVTPHDNAHDKRGPLTPVHLRQMLPFDTTSFYRYEGSLTTPPCTENVLWTLFEEPVAVPEEFLAGLRHLKNPEDTHHSVSNNFRPPQSMSGRSVFYSGKATEPHASCNRNRMQHVACASYPKIHYVSTEVNEVKVDVGRTEGGEDFCPVGSLPSPINLYLKAALPVYSPSLQWKRIGHCNGVQVINDGHVLKVLYPSAAPEWELIGSNLTSGYYLAGMQLRWSSEHHLGGLSFPLEVQLVHYNSKYKGIEEALKNSDGVVVVSKFFQEPMHIETTLESFEGFSEGHNDHLAGIIYAVQKDAQKPLGSVMMRTPDIPHLMGDTLTFYEYRGALGPLTHSICPSITATWMVIRQTGHISQNQLNSLREMKSADGSAVTSNNRPIASSSNRQVILRINSRELKHEFEMMMNRPKRALRMEGGQRISESTSPLSSSSLSPGIIITSLSVILVILSEQIGRH